MLKIKICWIVAGLLGSLTMYAQSEELDRFDPLLGEWTGNGEGFGNNRSSIHTELIRVMDGKYIEFTNESWFDPTNEDPDGEHHVDHGFIGYDRDRERVVYRQFNNEGYVNRYLLSDSLSSDSLLVFETESIENFVPGGKARLTLKILPEDHIETIFDVSFPGTGYTCFGTNRLSRKLDIVMENQTPRVTGIGGIFFRTSDPEKTRTWYGENLGLAINPYGSSFEFRNAHRPDEINYLQWSPFNENTDYFDPSDKEFMINYRVQNLEGLLEKLRDNGVEILDEVEVYEYGKFVHIMDPEGNKIELWEPVDSVFTEMGGPTTK